MPETADYLDTVEGRRNFHRETSHELIREIGGGAYGRVWLARSVTGALRAIKVVFRSNFRSDTPYDREYRGILKFEPISRDHDGFIDILHVGRNDAIGYFYYVMELGDDATDEPGQPLNPETYMPRTLDSERRRLRRLPFEESLRLALKLTLGLGALHQAGLVHRDIKPSNILLVGGQPKLADIGLVTDVGAEVSFVGTEGYIAPEGPGDPTADIYSLGKVLYEISTGNDRMLFPELPVDLLSAGESTQRFVEFNEILIKACDPKSAQRYKSAEDLHAHLALLQAGRSVRRLLEMERLVQRVRRYLPIAATLAAAAGIYFFLFLRERQRAVVEHQRQVASTVTFGVRSVEAGDYLGALPWLVEALRLDEGDAYKERAHRLRLASLLQRSPVPVQMWYFPHKNHDMYYAEFAPDFQHVLAANEDGFSALYSIASRERVSPYYGMGNDQERATLSPDGRWVVTTGSAAHKVDLWDTKTGAMVRTMRSRMMEHQRARFYPNGNRLLTSAIGHQATVWEVETGLRLFELPHTDIVRAVDVSPDGTVLATGTRNGKVNLWDATDGHPLRTFTFIHKGKPAWVENLALSPDGKRIAACANNAEREIRVWDIATGTELFPPMMHQDGVGSIKFSPDGKFLVSASWDTTVRIWNAQTGRAIDPPIRHSGKATFASFGSNSTQLLTVCFDGFVTLWKLPIAEIAPSPTERRYCPDGRGYAIVTTNGVDLHDAMTQTRIASIACGKSYLAPRYDHDGGTVITFSKSVSSNTTPSLVVQPWRVRDGSPVGQPIRTAIDFTNAVLSADGRRLALLARRRVECWDTQTGQPLGAFPLVSGNTRALMDRRGDRIIVVQHGIIDVHDVRTGQPLIQQSMQLAPSLTKTKEDSGRWKITSVDLSPDERQIIATYGSAFFERGVAQVWNLQDGSLAGPSLKHRDGVSCAQFSPDGRYIVTASEDFDAIVWNRNTFQPMPVPPFRHEHQAKTVAFSSDSRWVVSGGRDRAVQVWEAETSEVLSLPFLHAAEVAHARFVANDTQLFVTTTDGKSWLWNLPQENRPIRELQQFAQLLSGRRPTRNAAGILQTEEAIWESWQQLHTNFVTRSAVRP